MNEQVWLGKDKDDSYEMIESQSIQSSIAESFEDILDALQDAEETTRRLQRAVVSVLAYAEDTLNK